MKKLSIILALGVLAASCEQDLPAAKPSVPEQDKGEFSTVNYSGAYSVFFKPQVGWVGDVMPFFDPADGKFHIFYLADWRTSGPIHPIWHTETADFSSYGAIRAAIANGASTEQDGVIGTGSFIRGGDNRYYCFYTGERSASEFPRQGVMLASSDDLRTWRKEPSFGVLSASPDYDVNEFRDPQVFYDEADAQYHLVVTSYFQGRKALAHYVSADLQSWELLPEPLYVTDDTFMECPDVFRMGGKWYIVYSRIEAPRRVVYLFNDDLKDPSGWSDPRPLDGYNYYAAKTAADTQGNRYLAGWCQTFEGAYDSSGWGGSLVVHRLTQNADGTLNVSVPEGVAAGYAAEYVGDEPAASEGVASTGGGYTVPASGSVTFGRMPSALHVRVDVAAGPQAEFGFAFGAAADRTTCHKLHFAPGAASLRFLEVSDEGVVELNATTLSVSGTYRIDLYIEHSVCVCYIDGSRAFTCRIYPMEHNFWTLYADGGSVAFSNLALKTR